MTLKLTRITVTFLTLVKCKAVDMILNSRVVRPCFRFYSTTSNQRWHPEESVHMCPFNISHCLLSRLHLSHTTSTCEDINACVSVYVKDINQKAKQLGGAMDR